MTAAIATPLATAAPASAAGYHYDCAWKQVCLNYNSSSYGYGAYHRAANSVPNYAGYEFQAGRNGSSGAGQPVKNNAAYIHVNFNFGATVYYNSYYNCTVACQSVEGGENKNLNSSLKNENASMHAPI